MNLGFSLIRDGQKKGGGSFLHLKYTKRGIKKSGPADS